MPEGTTAWPTDAAAKKGWGIYDGTNFYFWRGDAARGHGGVVIYDSAGTAVAASAGSSDSLSAALNGLVGVGMGLDFNETSWDRHRGNVDRTLLASAARTGSTSSAQQVNYNHKGLLLSLNVTVIGSVTLTVSVRGIDPVGGGQFTPYGSLGGVGVAIEPVITTTGLYGVVLYPGAASANSSLVANSVVAAIPAILPRTWLVTILHSNANSATYSVGASLIL